MALLITGFGIRDSIVEIAPKQFEELFLYDMMVHYDASEHDHDKLAAAMQNEPDIAEYTQCMYQTMDIKHGGKSVPATVLTSSRAEELESFIQLRTRQDKTPVSLSDNGVILTEKAAFLLDAAPGDTVTLIDDDNEEYTVRVNGICENYVGHYVFMTSDHYLSVFNEDASYNTLLAGFKGEVSEHGESEISGNL